MTLWAATSRERFQGVALAGETRAEVAIVGAGYAGASLALHLAEQGVEVAVAEAVQPGAGASGRNASFAATIWSGVLPSAVEQRFGSDLGRRMNAVIARSGELVRTLVDRHGIDADCRMDGILMAAHRPSAIPMLRQLGDEWSARGSAMEWLDHDRLAELIASRHYPGALLIREAGTLNPLAFAQGLARAAVAAGARIYTDSPVAAVKPHGGFWRVETAEGRILARTVFVCANTAAGSVWPGLERLFYSVPYAIVASAPLSAATAAGILPGGLPLVDSHPAPPLSIRVDPEFRVVGSLPPPLFGRSDPARTAAPLAAKLRRVFPDLPPLRFEQSWIGQIDLAPDRLPRIFQLADGVFGVLGFSGQGITNATAIGQAAARFHLTGDSDVSVVQPSPATLARLGSFALANLAGPLARLGQRFSCPLSAA